MPDDQRFMSATESPLPRLEVNEAGDLRIPPDTFSAILLLLAVLDRDPSELLRIAQERPALPLLFGVVELAVSIGSKAYGDRLRQELDMLALSPYADPYDVADEYRARRTP